MTARIFIKLIVGVLCVLVVALAALDVLVTKLTEDTFLAERERDLTQKARVFAQLSDTGFSELPREDFIALARKSGVRITVVARNGVVLADSEGDPALMDNHVERPEIAAALRGQLGTSRRVSPTLGTVSFYVATPIPAGALRVAVPLSDIEGRIAAIRKETLISMIYAFVAAMLVAVFLARSVSSKLGGVIEFAGRLADGGFRRRLGWEGKDELTLLAKKLDETAEKLESTFDQLSSEHAELERIEQVRKDFVINVSHELRTPLASIQGYTETLLNGAIHEPENNIRFLTIIKANAERLGNLTKDLLTLSRIELNLQDLHWASYRVNSIVTGCIDSLQPLADQKNLSLSFVPASEATEVFCDAEVVHHALSNLLDNAIKYTPDGGEIVISARLLDHESGGASVEIAVKDSGQGIPRQELPRLFERFYRVDKARSRELGGTGLGLSIVKHLAKALGGTVRVESTPGEGALFAFTVPVQDMGLSVEREVKSVLTGS